jgi:hypothetical protein
VPYINKFYKFHIQISLKFLEQFVGNETSFCTRCFRQNTYLVDLLLLSVLSYSFLHEMLLAIFDVLTTALMKIHILWNINHAMSTVTLCQMTEPNIPAGLNLLCITAVCSIECSIYLSYVYRICYRVCLLCLHKYSIDIVHVHCIYKPQ